MGKVPTQFLTLLTNIICYHTILWTNPTNAITTATIPTELNCNYGVNYTQSSDFYETYILDTCYTLNTKITIPPLSVSLKYTCNFTTDEINENIWFNPICSDIMNHTRIANVETHCNLNKINEQCNFVWLSAFDQHSHECKPHPHTIIKFAMILDQCILYTADQSAFKNIYTQTENNRRQVIQFQYLNINDCIFDNITPNNIDVTQSIADDIYDFIHQECNNGNYYTVQPPETIHDTQIFLAQIEANVSNVTVTLMENTNITNTIMNEILSPFLSEYITDGNRTFFGYDILTIELVIFVLFISIIFVIC
eukprot:344777_1